MELGSLLGRAKNEALRGWGGAVRCLGKWEEREGKLAFADLRQLCMTTLGDECYHESRFISGETEAHITL